MDGGMEQSGSAPSGPAPRSLQPSTKMDARAPLIPDAAFASQQEAVGRAVTASPPGWPTLALQMHFFSEDENRSFVQVNGETYRAGEQLAAGPQVLGISSAGVTLAYQGERILLGMER